jgi:ATP-dependent Zn protease
MSRTNKIFPKALAFFLAFLLFFSFSGPTLLVLGQEASPEEVISEVLQAQEDEEVDEEVEEEAEEEEEEGTFWIAMIGWVIAVIIIIIFLSYLFRKRNDQRLKNDFQFTLLTI